MIALIGLVAHALAALLFGALAVWQLRRWNDDRPGRKLVLAFAAMSAFCSFVAFMGPDHSASGLAESARNLAFLGFLYGFVRLAAADRRQDALKLVYFSLGLVVGLQGTVALLSGDLGDARAFALFGLLVAAGALVMVHNFYAQAAPDSRSAIRLPAIALAGMWLYDLHYYTLAYLGSAAADELAALRGLVLAATVPAFALAMKRRGEWRPKVSRAATFQSVSLIAILLYLGAMMSAAEAVELAGSGWIGFVQLALVLAMSVIALLLLASRRARAWTGVMVAKHLFEHRYDYREEWLDFTRKLGAAGPGAAPLPDRIIRALADLAGAPSGLLLVADADRRLRAAAFYDWRHASGPDGEADAALIAGIERDGHILEFNRPGPIPLPEWMVDCEGAWAGVPLLHQERLVGIAILGHPPIRRPLDWEDFDLFRTAGMQAAGQLAEAHGQEALAEAQRFEEFNRRFAFIMHDIKNLVSQLSLVARNAERHAGNPEFRADMIATLQSSVAKMNGLLARLGRGGSDPGQLDAVPLGPLLATIAESRNRQHPVIVSGDGALVAVADPVRLEQAIVHLVQNAIEASEAGEPVRLHMSARGRGLAIEIVDRGVGMNPEFIRTRLFQPFASTKDGGFGIGAFEAKSLLAAMGARLDVESRPGEGTRFTILLHAAEAAAQPQRMSA